MSTDRITETIVEAWLAEGFTREPDIETTLGNVRAGVSATPQRRRRWWRRGRTVDEPAPDARHAPRRLGGWMPEDASSLGDPREGRPIDGAADVSEAASLGPISASLTWRTRTMFSATRIAASIAILTIGASLALVGGPLTPASGPAPGTSADPPPLPVLVHGESTSVDFTMGRIEPDENGVLTQSDSVSKTEPEMDDPRVSGTYRITLSGQNRGDMGPIWGTAEVENAEGTWEGPVRGYWGETGTHFSGCLAGDVAYDGVTYCLRATIAPGIVGATVEGIIYQGDLPPVE